MFELILYKANCGVWEKNISLFSFVILSILPAIFFRPLSAYLREAISSLLTHVSNSWLLSLSHTNPGHFFKDSLKYFLLYEAFFWPLWLQFEFSFMGFLQF